MRVPYCYKMFIFIIIAILLLVDNTNLAKADNYDSYEYTSYEYPDSRSKYIFFHACTDYFTSGP